MMTQMNSSGANMTVTQQDLQKIRREVKLALEQVMGNSSPEMLNEMSSIFLEDAIPLINQMKDGFSNGDYAAIRMAAHALKGSSATIGLDKFADACLALESSLDLDKQELVDRNIALVEREYAHIRSALSVFLFSP